MKRVLLILILVGSATAEDWPTYGHDNRRSHITAETLAFPLTESWAFRSSTPPQTAWTAPAKWDAFAANEGLQSMRNFDPAFFVTAVGSRVYFGSSADNAVHCLDATTGNEEWVAFADSAVRLPPTVANDRAWFGADDGFVYCVDTKSGDQLWRVRAAKDPRLIPSNGKLISPWPVRTGVLVENDVAYFAGSLFPWEPSYLNAIDAATGESRFVHELGNVTLQGAMLASAQRLYVPQGRSLPLVFAKATGSRLGDVAGSGGVWCILTEREEFISMPKNQKAKEDVVQLTDTAKQESILSIPGATRMLAIGDRIYFHQRQRLKAVDRNAPSVELWSASQPAPSALILAGEHLFLGGAGIVTAVRIDTGEQVWSGEVDGRAYGLAVANGRLFVSTAHGHIYTFAKHDPT